MPFPPTPTQLNCPLCNEPFTAEVRSIIDVGSEPELKEAWLAGEVNVARCPNCGGGGMVSLPLVYHDPEHELLLTYVPQELELSADQQEQHIGRLLSMLMNSLPAEQRKGYFFRPREMLTLDSLFDAVLEAEGFSKEMLAAHRERMALLQRLIGAADDDEALEALVEEHREALDYTFLMILSNLIESAESDMAAKLTALRDKILERVDPTPDPAMTAETEGELIEALRQATDAESLQMAVALNRPRLDYGFFQRLTERIENPEEDAERRQELSDLRQRLLEEIERQDRLVAEAHERAVRLIEQLLQADDPGSALHERRGELSDLFFAVLSQEYERALQGDDQELAERLADLLETALSELEEELPPKARLVNRLLRAEYPDGTNRLLEAHRGLLDDELLQLVQRYIERLQETNDEEALERLQQIRGQIEAKRSILRA